MPEKTEVRILTADDWNEFHENDLEMFPEDTLTEDWFRKRIEREGIFALWLDDRMIGQLILARYGEDQGHLGRIGVSKNHQGKGFGTVLMRYALDWFHSQDGIKSVHLYTQDFNKVAQSLYKKFGFKRTGTTWHYFVPYNSVMPSNEYTCQKIKEEEIDFVGSKYTSIPAEQIRRFLSSEDFLVLTLKDQDGNIRGACRFTPSFPGSFPFEIDNINHFDDFINGMKEYSLPEYDYCRITFTDIPGLPDLCEKRNYHLHHRLHKMTLFL